MREGNFTRLDVDVLDETEVFDGGKNTLRMEQVYTWQFQCNYQLQTYPFDTQVNVLLPCIAELQIKPKSKSDQTKNLERLYNWVVVVVVVVVVRTRRLGTRTNMSETEVE